MSSEQAQAKVLHELERRLELLPRVERGGLYFVDRSGVFRVLTGYARELLGPGWAEEMADADR